MLCDLLSNSRTISGKQRRHVILIDEFPARTRGHYPIGSAFGTNEYEIVRVAIEQPFSAGPGVKKRHIFDQQCVRVNDFAAAIDEDPVGRTTMPDEVSAPAKFVQDVPV